jgi:hypothetical protein
MKIFKKILVVFLSIFFLGCYEVNEEIVINADGSGTYVTKMDLTQMIEMMQSFGGDEMKQEGLDRIIDTVISMKSFTDSAKDMSEEEKQLLSRGKLRMQMNIKEKIFKVDTDFPFKSYKELQMLLSGSGGMMALSNSMKKVFGKGDQPDNAQPDTPKDPDLGQISDVFEVTVTDGSISKKFNKAKYDAMMSKPEMEQMKQVGSAGIEILTTTVIKLPRPVKSSDNPSIKLSDDKKTATFKYNFLEIFDNPEKFSYNITF